MIVDAMDSLGFVISDFQVYINIVGFSAKSTCLAGYFPICAGD